MDKTTHLDYVAIETYVAEVIRRIPADFKYDRINRTILYQDRIVGSICYSINSNRTDFLYRNGVPLSPILYNIFPKEDGTPWAIRYQGFRIQTDSASAISFEEFIRNIREIAETRIADNDKKTEFINKFKGIIDNSELSKSQKKQLRSCVGKKTKLFTAWGSYYLSDDVEEKLFLSLLNGDSNAPEDTQICRYCSIESLLQTILSGATCMMSTECMNDKSENEYVDKYLHISPWQRNLLGVDNKKTFILSGSDICMTDKLFMWNMYAKESTGACLKYDINTTYHKDFKIARVSYADDNRNHKELSFIATLIDNLNITLNQLSTWKHFFKPYEYKEEQEIRILIRKEPSPRNNGMYTIDWVLAGGGILTPRFLIKNGNSEYLFPLSLKEIVLGPKCKDASINKEQLSCLLKSKGDKVGKIMISLSSIRTLR